MGIKGVHISVGLTTLATTLMLVALGCEWQILSFYGVIVSRVHLTSIYFDGDDSLPVDRMSSKLRFRDLNGNLSKVRDIVCGVPYHYFSTMCESFTTDFGCGVFVVLLCVTILIINLIACFYLLYYSWGVTKREYRKVAFRCLCAAPILIFVALFCYAGAIFFSTSLNTTTVFVVVTPGAGYFVAMVSFVVMAIVPFVSQKWALSTKEILDGEKRQTRREAKDSFLSDQRSYGTMYNQQFPVVGAFPEGQGHAAYPPLHGQYYQDSRTDGSYPAYGPQRLAPSGPDRPPEYGHPY